MAAGVAEAAVAAATENARRSSDVTRAALEDGPRNASARLLLNLVEILVGDRIRPMRRGISGRRLRSGGRITDRLRLGF
ncbi:conserved protein of unknown function [Methylorubrum extorquens]|uniref:Uncharacterized protein n=1 Tax=Methylorubrum extorquens TaxID=408 RepID=A0A2N9AR01_METEX|nr:conserved protein of unknown function [Methylorubrum extorquens]